MYHLIRHLIICCFISPLSHLQSIRMKTAWSPSPFQLTIYSETISAVPNSTRFCGSFRTGLLRPHGSALTTCTCTESCEPSAEYQTPTWQAVNVSVNLIHTRSLFETKPLSVSASLLLLLSSLSTCSGFKQMQLILTQSIESLLYWNTPPVLYPF